jgi:hypothetical protein
MSGYYHDLIERRDAILSTARMSDVARARALGKPLYPASPAQPKPIAPKPEPSRKRRVGLGPLTPRERQVVIAFCTEFEVAVDDVLSYSRERKFARPRQAIMHFLWVETQMSQTQIGASLQRDHTTVLSGSRVAVNLLRCNEDFSVRYHRAERAIRAMWAE